jgi:hypothetical protein
MSWSGMLLVIRIQQRKIYVKLFVNKRDTTISHKKFIDELTTIQRAKQEEYDLQTKLLHAKLMWDQQNKAFVKLEAKLY